MIEPTPRARDHAALASDRQARKTVLTVACVLLLIALWNLYRGRAVAVGVIGGLALALALAGLLLPRLARRFHVFWMRVAVALGAVNSRILLTLVFYGIFTPYGFFSRLFRRDPLNRRSAARASYWTRRPRARQEREQFERLF